MKTLVLCLALFLSFGQAHAQLANLDFENWDTSANANNLFPTGWESLRSSYCRQIANAQHGNYALQVSVWYWYVKSAAVQTAPINYKPTSLQGYYTYTDNVLARVQTSDTIEDTARANVILTHWDGGLQKRDTIGFGELILAPTSTYTQFICPINYQNSVDNPDSVTIVLDPSLATGSGGRYNATSLDGYCSYLTVDHLSLQSITAIEPTPTPTSFQLYPNPTSDYFTIELPVPGTYHLVMVNTLGQVCLGKEIKGPKGGFSVKGLPVGQYVVGIYDEHMVKIGSKSLVKQ